jgi:hypothetical protein
MLFQFPETGDDAGKLVALLVNKRSATHGTSVPKPNAKNAKARPWEHHHNPEYQVLSDRASDVVEKSDGEDNAGIVPKSLPLGVNLEITAPNPPSGLPDPPAVVKSRSFLRYVPNLDNIIDHGSPEVLKLKAGKRTPNLTEDLVSNVVKINRGTALVRDIVIWDEAAYPLSGNRLDRGERPRMPAVAKFMGSRVSGHMASEIIVQIDDANTVDVHAYRKLAAPKGKKAAKQTRETVHKRGHKGFAGPNPHVPEDTVEIVVSNYEYQRGTPVPWSLDFQWLFEVAGYGEADLAGREFDAWTPFARKYHEGHFEGDRGHLLRKNDVSGENTVGRPFPYLESHDALAPSTALTSLLERPLCSHGITTRPISDSF